MMPVCPNTNRDVEKNVHLHGNRQWTASKSPKTKLKRGHIREFQGDSLDDSGQKPSFASPLRPPIFDCKICKFQVEE